METNSAPALGKIPVRNRLDWLYREAARATSGEIVWMIIVWDDQITAVVSAALAQSAEYRTRVCIFLNVQQTETLHP
jgi:hypothetical protein